VVLLGAVVVATLPEWRQQTMQGRLAPGSNFVYALQVLKLLWQAQQRGDAVTVPQLHSALHIRYERIEIILDTMQRASWVNRAAPVGWVLHRNPATIPWRMFTNCSCLIRNYRCRMSSPNWYRWCAPSAIASGVRRKCQWLICSRRGCRRRNE
jgi:hypothetical protein